MELFGILNLTPDSFSDGGQHVDPEQAARAALRLAAEGADMLDVGGESTRPGSAEISVDEELRRVIPVLDLLAGKCPVPISIDTRRVPVAEAARERGATILNDTSALRDDPELAAWAAHSGVTVVLMHRQGTPATMQWAPRYDSLIDDLRAFFAERVAAAGAAGIDEQRIVLDPGLGFGKRPADNYTLVAHLRELAPGDFPFLVGASRKSFLALHDERPPAERLPGSLAFAAAARAAGARYLRVHDVADTARFLRTLTQLDEARRDTDGGALAEGAGGR